MSTEATGTIVTEALKPLPKAFKDLKRPELVAAADRFGTEREGSLDLLRADLENAGVTWEMYEKEFLKPKAVEEELEPFELPAPLDVEEWEDAEEVEPITVTTAPAVPVLTQEKYLIKMVRANPYFEFKKYKFTQERPYAIMSAADAQEILSTERDFRQAFPDELQEFYS